METVERTQRADARRNREAVIASAIKLLNTDPDACMGEIAIASKVGRTTLYRHFPTREDLLLAIFGRVIEESHVMTSMVVAEATDARDMLRRLSAGMIGIGLRFRFLHAYRQVGQQTIDDSKKVPDDASIIYLIEAQKRGDVRPELPWQWIASIIQALAIAILDDTYTGVIDEARAEQLLSQTLIAALLVP